MAAREELILLAWNDLVGITRGRGIPLSAFAERKKLGINWAMAGHALTPFEDIADNPWGALMEAQMLPDPSTRVRVEVAKGYPPLSFVLCDGYNLDGTVWDSPARAGSIARLCGIWRLKQACGSTVRRNWNSACWAPACRRRHRLAGGVPARA